MKKIGIILTFCIILAGCASPNFKQAVTEKEQVAQMEIRWVVTETPEVICGKLKYNGCALLNQDVCTIVTPMPSSFLNHRALEVVGHEVWHCFHGPIHD
jgi:hypothetical protein